MNSLSLICQALDPIAGKRVLDVGCGPGYLAKALLARGARMVGVDPAEDAIAAARRIAPEAKFHVAGGEKLPFADRSFGGVVFLSSLHHAPLHVMESCLTEAGRVTAPEGKIVVIEPLAEGSFFEAFRAIEDETEVRAAAQEAVAAVLSRKALALVEQFEYVRCESFENVDQFLNRAAAADRSRDAIIRERRAAIEATLGKVAGRDEHGGFVLDQPLRAHVLAPVA